MMIKVYTIGFAGKSARQFFETLEKHNITKVIDVRLNNTSQLAGFTKRDDLEFFVERLLGGVYLHEPKLAPSKELLQEYKKNKISWEEYERRFTELLEKRSIISYVTPEWFAVPTVLLCSESSPLYCHRRLILEYLQKRWKNLEIKHL